MTTTEPRLLAHPATGELLNLDGDITELAVALDSLREFEAALRDAKRTISDELLQRMDKAAKWTVDVPGVGKITAPSPQPKESWDGDKLLDRLLPFVLEGHLTGEALEAAVTTKVIHEPRKAGIVALRKRGGQIADVINELAVVSDPVRYVTVRNA